MTAGIDPTAVYTPREVGKILRMGYDETLAAIVRGDLKATKKPPSGRYSLVLGKNALAWFESMETNQ